jgi:hypothetical protein
VYRVQNSKDYLVIRKFQLLSTVTSLALLLHTATED